MCTCSATPTMAHDTKRFKKAGISMQHSVVCVLCDGLCRPGREPVWGCWQDAYRHLVLKRRTASDCWATFSVACKLGQGTNYEMLKSDWEHSLFKTCDNEPSETSSQRAIKQENNFNHLCVAFLRSEIHRKQNHGIIMAILCLKNSEYW